MNIQRRPLIVSGMALVAVPRLVIAQTPARVWRVGVLVPAGSSLQLAPWGAFIAELSRLGYVEGRNLAFEICHAGQNSRSLDNLAAELAGLKVDLVFAAAGTPSVRAAMKATTSIPIVMLSSAEPVRDGLVASLARPGGNVTGNSIFGLELAVKRQQLISQALGKPSRIAYLASSSSRSLPHLEEYYAALTAAAKADGAQFEPTLLQSMGDLDAAFERIARQRPDALVLDNPAVFFAQAERFAALATRYRLPTIADGRGFAVAGLQ